VYTVRLQRLETRDVIRINQNGGYRTVSGKRGDSRSYRIRTDRSRCEDNRQPSMKCI